MLFVLGSMLFLVEAVRRARMDGVRTTTALSQRMRDALRFAWHLLP
jgi:hypothetical protein